MRFRTFVLLSVFALVVAACSPSGAGTDTTPTAGEDQQAESADTTEQAAPAPEAMLLSYNLQAGDSFTYEVGIDQRIDLTAEGDPSAMGDEEIPGEMAINFTGTTSFTHDVAEGQSQALMR